MMNIRFLLLGVVFEYMDFYFVQFLLKSVLIEFCEFMKLKKNRSEILSNFPVVAPPYLCYVSESKGTHFY